jgi:hypothetical protein
MMAGLDIFTLFLIACIAVTLIVVAILITIDRVKSSKVLN